jgi:DNA-3-methyladenine glycosylase II
MRYEAGDVASRAIASADPTMARLIDAEGCVEFGPVEGGPFEVLVRGIVGQQLSAAAAGSIYRRLSEVVGLTPARIARASEADLHGVGLSWRKVSYVRGLARATIAGDFDPDAIAGLDDDAAVRELERIRGVGRWTAHMFLLFALGRTDVLPVDDLGVRAAAGRVLGLGRPATAGELEAAGERWRPYRSAAALYLWRQGRSGFGICGRGEARAAPAPAAGTKTREVSP